MPKRIIPEHRCTCHCHSGVPGFYHCFMGDCCDRPNVACDPPPMIPAREVLTPSFETVTMDQFKDHEMQDIGDILAENTVKDMKGKP